MVGNAWFWIARDGQGIMISKNKFKWRKTAGVFGERKKDAFIISLHWEEILKTFGIKLEIGEQKNVCAMTEREACDEQP